MSVADFVMPLAPAVMIAVVFDEVATVDTVKVADVLPGSTVTADGTVALPGWSW